MGMEVPPGLRSTTQQVIDPEEREESREGSRQSVVGFKVSTELSVSIPRLGVIHPPETICGCGWMGGNKKVRDRSRF
jgi:hypothetical protein